MRIALALHVAGSEGALEPDGFSTPGGGFAVIEAVVAENVSLGIVGGADDRSAMNQTMRLIKVGGIFNIVGDNAIVLPKLRDTVDLNGEQDRNANAIQFTSEHDYGGGSPTVAEQNNPGPRFLFRGENAVVIAVE